MVGLLKLSTFVSFSPNEQYCETLSGKLFLEINTEQLAIKPQRKFFCGFPNIPRDSTRLCNKEMGKKECLEKQYNFDAPLLVDQRMLYMAYFFVVLKVLKTFVTH